MDSTARARQRVLALFLPIAALLYMSAEGLNPKGTDQLVQTTATAFRVLPIAARHPVQLYVSGSLTLLALGALAVSYPAIATLVRNRGAAVATVAALIGGLGAFCGAIVNVLVGINLAAAVSAHMTQEAAARFLVTTFNSGAEQAFSGVYFLGIFVAPVLMGFALWRSRQRPALAGGPVRHRPGGCSAAVIFRGVRGGVHAAIWDRDGAAGSPDVAGGCPAGWRHPGAGPRTREQHLRTSRTSSLAQRHALGRDDAGAPEHVVAEHVVAGAVMPPRRVLRQRAVSNVVPNRRFPGPRLLWRRGGAGSWLIAARCP